MRAMVLSHPHTPLQLVDLPVPEPTGNQVLIKVMTCGVCRTDLHIVAGELTHPKLPLVLGHQVVGLVVKWGPQAHRFKVGQRVGAPWLGKSCGHCLFCQQEQENLCETALFRGYQIDGGFAEYCVADEDYLFPIPEHYSSLQAAPLLCAGLIGYRSLRLAEPAKRLGFYGFGAAAHILIQIAKHQGKEVFAFTRQGDKQAQSFAKSLGAKWVGHSEEAPPVALDSAIIFAPVGSLVPLALKAIRPGGSVVCAGIYMTDIPAFPYSLLYGERLIRSVTNLTRQDGEEFFKIASELPLQTSVTPYPLERANEALTDLKEGKLSGSAVLVL